MIAGAELLPVITPTSTNPANEVARALTGRDYSSWSAISTFRSCPLKYFFRYVAGLPEESVSSALAFGTGINAAIEDLYRAELAGEAKPEVEQLMFAYRSAWLPHDPEKISFGSSETRASLDALAGKMLTAFLKSPAARFQGRVLGVEEEIRGTLVEGVPDLQPDRLGDGGLGFTRADRFQDVSRKVVHRAGRRCQRTTGPLLEARW